MSNEFLFDLCPGWALSADEHQWIVLKRRNSRTQSGWKPVSYIGSNKSTLLRVLREKDITLYKAAEQRIAAFEERFIDWRSSVKPSHEVVA